MGPPDSRRRQGGVTKPLLDEPVDLQSQRTSTRLGGQCLLGVQRCGQHRRQQVHGDGRECGRVVGGELVGPGGQVRQPVGERGAHAVARVEGTGGELVDLAGGQGQQCPADLQCDAAGAEAAGPPPVEGTGRGEEGELADAEARFPACLTDRRLAVEKKVDLVGLGIGPADQLRRPLHPHRGIRQRRDPDSVPRQRPRRRGKAALGDTMQPGGDQVVVHRLQPAGHLVVHGQVLVAELGHQHRCPGSLRK